MSSTGARDVGQADPEALATVIGGPPPMSREEAAERWVRASKVAGSPGYPDDEAGMRELALLAYDRSYDPAGMARQSIAILASGERTPLLHSLRLPTLVIHGSDDLLLPQPGIAGPRPADPTKERGAGAAARVRGCQGVKVWGREGQRGSTGARVSGAGVGAWGRGVEVCPSSRAPSRSSTALGPTGVQGVLFRQDRALEERRRTGINTFSPQAVKSRGPSW